MQLLRLMRLVVTQPVSPDVARLQKMKGYTEYVSYLLALLEVEDEKTRKETKEEARSFFLKLKNTVRGYLLRKKQKEGKWVNTSAKAVLALLPPELVKAYGTKQHKEPEKEEKEEKEQKSELELPSDFDIHVTKAEFAVLRQKRLQRKMGGSLPDPAPVPQAHVGGKKQPTPAPGFFLPPHLRPEAPLDLPDYFSEEESETEDEGEVKKEDSETEDEGDVWARDAVTEDAAKDIRYLSKHSDKYKKAVKAFVSDLTSQEVAKKTFMDIKAVIAKKWKQWYPDAEFDNLDVLARIPKVIKKRIQDLSGVFKVKTVAPPPAPQPDAKTKIQAEQKRREDFAAQVLGDESEWEKKTITTLMKRFDSYFNAARDLKTLIESPHATADWTTLSGTQRFTLYIHANHAYTTMRQSARTVLVEKDKKDKKDKKEEKEEKKEKKKKIVIIPEKEIRALIPRKFISLIDKAQADWQDIKKLERTPVQEGDDYYNLGDPEAYGKLWSADLSNTQNMEDVELLLSDWDNYPSFGDGLNRWLDYMTQNSLASINKTKGRNRRIWVMLAEDQLDQFRACVRKYIRIEIPDDIPYLNDPGYIEDYIPEVIRPFLNHVLNLPDALDPELKALAMKHTADLEGDVKEDVHFLLLNSSEYCHELKHILEDGDKEAFPKQYGRMKMAILRHLTRHRKLDRQDIDDPTISARIPTAVRSKLVKSMEERKTTSVAVGVFRKTTLDAKRVKKIEGDMDTKHMTRQSRREMISIQEDLHVCFRLFEDYYEFLGDDHKQTEEEWLEEFQRVKNQYTSIQKAIKESFPAGDPRRDIYYGGSLTHLIPTSIRLNMAQADVAELAVSRDKKPVAALVEVTNRKELYEFVEIIEEECSYALDELSDNLDEVIRLASSNEDVKKLLDEKSAPEASPDPETKTQELSRHIRETKVWIRQQDNFFSVMLCLAKEYVVTDAKKGQVLVTVSTNTSQNIAACCILSLSEMKQALTAEKEQRNIMNVIRAKKEEQTKADQQRRAELDLEIVGDESKLRQKTLIIRDVLEIKDGVTNVLGDSVILYDPPERTKEDPKEGIPDYNEVDDTDRKMIRKGRIEYVHAKDQNMGWLEQLKKVKVKEKEIKAKTREIGVWTMDTFSALKLPMPRLKLKEAQESSQEKKVRAQESKSDIDALKDKKEADEEAKSAWLGGNEIEDPNPSFIQDIAEIPEGEVLVSEFGGGMSVEEAEWDG